MQVLLDARKGVRATWPVGAHRADLERDLSAPGDPSIGGRHPLPDVAVWCDTLGRWGITPDTDVLVFDDRQGGLAAARCWWMLRAVGHDRVRVCDLADLDVPMTQVPTPSADGPPYPATAWSWPIVDGDAVEARRLDPRWRVIDARSGPRFRGEVEPLDPIAGHIPGAVNVPWEETTELSVARQRLIQALGQVPPERVIVHCGSGVTACHTLLQLDRLGLGGAALYVGSWSAWCRQDRPREPSA